MADYCEHGDEHTGCVEGCESSDPLSLTDSAEWSESEPYEGHLAALYSTVPRAVFRGMRTAKPARALSCATVDTEPGSVCQRFRTADAQGVQNDRLRSISQYFKICIPGHWQR